MKAKDKIAWLKAGLRLISSMRCGMQRGFLGLGHPQQCPQCQRMKRTAMMALRRLEQKEGGRDEQF